MDLTQPVPATRRRRAGGFWPSVPERKAWHYWAALPLLAVFGWFAFVQGSRVPVLGWLDLALHEFGHVWTVWLPRVGNLAMGSGTQVGVPLLIAGGMWFASRDPLGAGIALGWAGTSAQDASVYIADAPFQQLQLIGGVHDWATLLGPRHLDALWAADDLARLVWGFGLLCWVAAVALVAWHGWHTRHRPSPMEEQPPPTTWSLPAS